MSGYQHDEIVERYGFHFKLTFERDEGMGSPWQENDGHGPVEEYRYGYHKRPGQRPLVKPWHHQNRNTIWMYDWQAAMQLAKKDGWYCEPSVAEKYFGKPASTLTARQLRAAAVEEDFDLLRRWLDDDWWWICAGVHCVETDEDDYLGGLCSDDHEYIDEWVDETIDRLVPLTKFERKMREAAEKAR